MIADIEKSSINNNPDDRYAKLYLVHHMHHFKDGTDIKHELHHCQLYSQKNMNGEIFEIQHKIGEDIDHIVAPIFDGVLYDHANNEFTVKNGKILI